MGMNKVEYLLRSFNAPNADQIRNMIVDVVLSDMRSASPYDNPQDVVKALLSVYHAVAPDEKLMPFAEAEDLFRKVYSKVTYAETREMPGDMSWPDAMPECAWYTRKIILRVARYAAAHDVVVGEELRKLALERNA